MFYGTTGLVGGLLNPDGANAGNGYFHAISTVVGMTNAVEHSPRT